MRHLPEGRKAEPQTARQPVKPGTRMNSASPRCGLPSCAQREIRRPLSERPEVRHRPEPGSVWSRPPRARGETRGGCPSPAAIRKRGDANMPSTSYIGVMYAMRQLVSNALESERTPLGGPGGRTSSPGSQRLSHPLVATCARRSCCGTRVLSKRCQRIRWPGRPAGPLAGYLTRAGDRHL
jgi:hypothetical protein